MYKKKYSGIIPPLVTPLTSNEKLDKEALERLIEYDIRNGVSGVFVNGTSGEALRLTDSVWEDTTKNALELIHNRIPIFCGAIDTSTYRTIERIKKIENMGGSIAVCTAPFYLTSFGQDEILRHFDTICHSTSIEIAVYNIPETTHVNIQPETVKRLAEYESITVFKDSTADWQHLQRIIMATQNTSLSVFNGAEELCAVSMLFGADGCIPGLANFIPGVFTELRSACLSNNIETAYEIQKKINQIRKCIFVNGCWMSGMKELLEIFQLGSNQVSSPLLLLNPDEKKQMVSILKEFYYA